MTPVLNRVGPSYLYLLSKTLTRFPFNEDDRELLPRLDGLDEELCREIRRWSQVEASAAEDFDADTRALGLDWPAEAETMVGLIRLANLEQLTRELIEQGIPGDFMETGVWRGGASIFLRAALEAHGERSRIVWLADSFQGLPKPDPMNYPADEGDELWAWPELAVSMEEVKRNFRRYGLLDDQVRFLPGWFRDTLPAAPVQRLALLRLDGDLYESTIIGLRSLYSRIERGGYVVVDDYGAVAACKQAVHDFRSERNISEPMHEIDWTGVYWRVNNRQQW